MMSSRAEFVLGRWAASVAMMSRRLTVAVRAICMHAIQLRFRVLAVILPLVSLQAVHGQAFFGRSDPKVPVVNGVTDVGEITLLEDADRDGMDDAYERANGLDPNDPTDGSLDPDGDELTNLVESRLGTLAQVADSDGDGVSDGAEVAAGTDPLDPLSVPAGVIVGLTVSPAFVNMTINSILDAPTRQLKVLATFTGGAIVDVTASARGTTYSSANPAVAFVSSEGGIFAVSEGFTTVTVTNGPLSKTIAVNVRRFDPTALGFVAVPGAEHAAESVPGFAFITGKDPTSGRQTL